MTSRATKLLAVLRQALINPHLAISEKELQERIASGLGACELELRTTFEAPLYAPIRPPRSAMLELERRNRQVPAEGRDPCTQRGKLDILWEDEGHRVPIELKFVPERKSDVWGYQFLKDIHRLERLAAVDGHPRLAAQRFALFVTSEPVYWRGGRPEPAPFSLRDGLERSPKTWVQYDQSSPDTQWYSYPPFYLANRYRFEWHDIARGFRALLVTVAPQRASLALGA